MASRLPNLLLAPLIAAALISPTRAEESAVPPAATTGRMLQQLVSEDDWILRADAMQFLAEHKVADAAGPIGEILTDAESEPWLRGRALVALAHFGSPPDLGPYIAHENSELRAATAEVLELFPESATAVDINQLIEDEEPAVSLRALAALARRQGEMAAPIVAVKTADPPAKGIQWAARAMALTGVQNEIDRLADMALTEKNRPHLNKIIRGIRDLPHPGLIPVLLQILVADPDSLPAVVSALKDRNQGQLLAALDKALERRDPATTRAVANVMTASMQVPELGSSLARALGDVEDVDTIRAGLVALGSSAMQPDRHRDLFAKFLKHGELDVRALAIRCLAHCKEANLFDEFRASLGDGEPVVVQAVLSALLLAPLDTAPRGQLVDYLQAPLVGKDEVARDLAYELLGKAGGAEDFQPAIAMLGHLLRGNDPELRDAAAKALGEIAPLDRIGEVVSAQGYLANWRVLGTFFNDADHSAFDAVLPPEPPGEIDLEATYPTKYVWVIENRPLKDDQEKIEREISWADAVLDRTNGKLVMSTQLPPPGSYSAGYALADFEVDAERDALLDVSGDDAFRVWLNGEKITEAVAEYTRREPCVAEKLAVAIRLKAGANRLLIKSANIDYEWWLRVRITDKEGKPIELLTP